MADLLSHPEHDANQIAQSEDIILLRVYQKYLELGGQANGG